METCHKNMAKIAKRIKPTNFFLGIFFKSSFNINFNAELMSAFIFKRSKCPEKQKRTPDLGCETTIGVPKDCLLYRVGVPFAIYKRPCF